MQFKVDCESFKEKLNNVQAASRYNKSGISANIKLDIKEKASSLRLTGTNEFVVISDNCDISEVVGGDASFLVDANKLSSTTSSYSKGEHAFNLKDETNLLIQTPHPKYNLRAMTPDQFVLPEFDGQEDVTFSVSAGTLVKVLNKTAPFAASTKEWRNFLIGVNLELSSKQLVAVATDTHKLAFAKLDIQASGELSVILPINAVHALQTVLSGHTEESQVKASFSSNFATFKVGTVEIIAQLISAKFPDYDRVLPKNQSSGKLTISRQAFQQAIKLATPIVGNSGMIVVNLDSKKIEIEASNADSESFTDQLPIGDDCSFNGSPLKIGFNLNLIQTALETIESDTVILEFYGDASGTKVTDSSGDGNEIYIIMPMRI